MKTNLKTSLLSTIKESKKKDSFNFSIRIYAVILLLVLMHQSCMPFRPQGEIRSNVQRGLASWYGKDFHGKPTASGEIYDMHKLTAAHKTVPLGIYAIVENLENHKRVKVKINDRGPFVGGRIIDLSYAAAKKINMIGSGTAKVKVTFLKNFDLSDEKKYYFQIASFTDISNANELRDRLLEKNIASYVEQKRIEGKMFYRVCSGPYQTQSDINDYKRKLRSLDLSPIVTSSKCIR